MSLTLRQVADGLWWLTTGGASGYLWAGADGGWVVVDPGLPGAGADVLEAVSRASAAGVTRGRRRAPEGLVAAVVLTHWHADHSGAATEVAQVTGAPVYAGALDAQVLRYERVPSPPVLTSDEQALHAAITTGGALPEPPSVPQVGDLRTDEPLLVRHGVRVLSVGGHTPGSVALHLPAVRALLTGDLARTDDGGGAVALGRFHVDPATARWALVTLAELDPDVVGVGHGPPVRSGGAAALVAAAGRRTPTADEPSTARPPRHAPPRDPSQEDLA